MGNLDPDVDLDGYGTDAAKILDESEGDEQEYLQKSREVAMYRVQRAQAYALVSIARALWTSSLHREEIVG